VPYAAVVVQIAAAVQDPSTSTLPRRAGSMRRTSHMDVHFLGEHRLELVGRARDLRTGVGGAAESLGEAQIRAVLGPTRQLEAIEPMPEADVSGLLGVPVSGGFRAAVDRVVPAQSEQHTPLYLLLDDLPVVALISGYATLYLGDGPRVRSQPGEGDRAGPRSDICAGWRGDGLMMRAIASEGSVPTPVGPAAPVLEPSDDPLAWHLVPKLPAGAMRRRRLIDVARDDDDLVVSAMFRDTHVDSQGIETVLHEYELAMDVDAETMIVRGCAARPRTLPWPECPAAAASAERLAGQSVEGLRRLVRQEFRGTSTCTHLNDLLRSLADVDVLARALF
jgi:hypothetical protein